MVRQEIVSAVFKYWRMDMTAHVQTLTTTNLRTGSFWEEIIGHYEETIGHYEEIIRPCCEMICHCVQGLMNNRYVQYLR
jgi:hypothetical protein